MSSTHVLETAKQLVNHGPQLLSRLFGLKAELLTLPKRGQYLKDSEWNKLRYRLEKRFPGLPDFDKISGSKSFLTSVAEIRSDLSNCYHVFCQVSDFIKSAKEVMEKIPKLVFELKIRRNRPILLLWAQIFVFFMKISYMLDLLPEKFVLLPMYCAASQLSGIEISVQRLEEIRTILVDGDNFIRKCIDHFSPLRQYIGGIMIEMKDSVFFASDSEYLRNNSVFNPVYDGSNMGLPSNRVLSATNDLSVYSEMCRVDSYYEFIVFGVIAAPHFLFDETVLGLLTEVVKYRALIPLYRDLSVNIHIELEKVSLLFPNDADKFSIPKGFKLQNRLKQLSRDSLKNIGNMQKKRRRILLNDLNTWGNLFQVSPGCVGPKLPVILAACSLLKSDVVAFFRHYSGFLCRKDAKGYYDPSTLKDSDDIGACLYTLYLIENILDRSESTVISYYLEYLFRADFEFLQQFEDLYLNHLSGMIHMYESITRCTESFHLYHKDDTTEIMKISDTIYDEFMKILIFSSNPAIATVVNAHSQVFERFVHLMYVVLDHCTFICDRLRLQYYVKCLNPYEAGWFRAAWLDIFAKTVRSTSLNGSFGVFTHNKHVNYYSMMFFRPFQDILYNLESGNGLFYSDDNPSEMEALGSSAIIFADTMLTYIADFVKATIKTLWEYLRALEAQYHPTEVINRIQRLHAMLNQNTDQQQHNVFVPGMESDLWATSQIKDFIKLQEQLCNVLLGIHKTIPSSIQIYTRVYKIEQFVYESVIKHFRSHLIDHFTTVDKSTLCRFSMGTTRFTHGFLTLQFIAQSLPNTSFAMALKELIFSDIIPAVIVPPVGIPIFTEGEKTNVVDRIEILEKPPTLIARIASWFSELVDQISRGTSGDDNSTGIAYVPHRKTFINLNRFKKLLNSSIKKSSSSTSKTNTTLFSSVSTTISHPEFAIEMYLSKDELVALCRIIGIQGMKVIETNLLEQVVEQMFALRNHFKEDKEYFEMFENRVIVDPSIVCKISKLLDCKKALKSIGLALILREHLMEAVREVMNSADHDIVSSVNAMFESFNSWSDSSLNKQSLFHGLCHDFGVTDSRDIPLFTCLYEKLKEGLTFADLKILYQSLPLIGAALLINPLSWQQNEYIPELEIFEGNDYAIQYALAKVLVFNHNAFMTAIMGHCDRQMMSATLASIPDISLLLIKNDTEDFEHVSLFEKLNIDEKELLSSSQIDNVARQPSAPVNKIGIEDPAIASILGSPTTVPNHTALKPRDISISRGSSVRDCSNYICRTYLKLASDALLSARRANEITRWDLPFAAIAKLLEQFVNLHPAGMSPGHLEQFLPYDVIHFDFVDASIGKLRPSSSYGEFKPLPRDAHQMFGTALEAAQTL